MVVRVKNNKKERVVLRVGSFYLVKTSSIHTIGRFINVNENGSLVFENRKNGEHFLVDPEYLISVNVLNDANISGQYIIEGDTVDVTRDLGDWKHKYTCCVFEGCDLGRYDRYTFSYRGAEITLTIDELGEVQLSIPVSDQEAMRRINWKNELD